MTSFSAVMTPFSAVMTPFSAVNTQFSAVNTQFSAVNTDHFYQFIFGISEISVNVASLSSIVNQIQGKKQYFFNFLSVY